MTPALGVQNSALTVEALREIARQSGPCLTMLVPDRHPGAHEPSRAAVVRGMARSAEEKASAQQLDSEALLQPIKEYASQLETDEGGPGIALFRAPDFLAKLSVPGIREGSVTLSRYFHLAPLMTAASVPHDYYILALNRKNLRLYRYQQGHCEQVDLPAGVPANMEASLDMDWPDHRLQNRSPAGSSTGAMGGVQFGTSSDRETASEHLHHFFQLVDRGLKDLLKDKPLLLAGVHEEVAAYRRAARNQHLLEPEIHGNIDFWSPAQIAEQASAAALAHYRRAGAAVLGTYQEMPDRKRTRGTARTVSSAALKGRVHQLCAAEGAIVMGSLAKGFEHEDLVNAAIVETLRHGGEVFMLPAESMPEGAPLAAILRF